MIYLASVSFYNYVYSTGITRLETVKERYIVQCSSLHVCNENLMFKYTMHCYIW